MKKNYFVALSLVLITGIGTTLSLAIATEDWIYPKEAITIDGKKPAKFNHQTHVDLGVKCGHCHHDGEHNPLVSEAIAALPIYPVFFPLLLTAPTLNLST